MTDTIAAMLTKIRNAQRAGRSEVVVPSSKLKLAIAKTLEREGFIDSALPEKSQQAESIRIALKYRKISRTVTVPAITGIRRVSREGQRMYIGYKDIKNVKNNFGIGIISTPKGVLTNRESKELKVGGEYICEVW